MAIDCVSASSMAAGTWALQVALRYQPVTPVDAIQRRGSEQTAEAQTSETTYHDAHSATGPAEHIDVYA